MSHPQIEELSSSESDPSIDDPTDFAPNEILRPSKIPARSTSRQPNIEHLQPQFQQRNTNDPEKHKHYQCLYPLYFDASRTRAQGRRVGKDQAVANPLARTIVDAVASLSLTTVFEPGKMHPKDWGNPGRVRVLLKDPQTGKSKAGPRIKNKHHLYIQVSEYLQKHPTTVDTPLRYRIAGMPPSDKPVPPPAVPRGWHINEILPLHSPALSGGGVSENILRDMMGQMGGAEGGGMGGGMPGGMDMGAMQQMLAGMGGMGGGGGGAGGEGSSGGGKKKGKGKKG
ncbi:MAG: hypothetical protein Q9202_003203 [Teloschistes flavicans]